MRPSANRISRPLSGHRHRDLQKEGIATRKSRITEVIMLAMLAMVLVIGVRGTKRLAYQLAGLKILIKAISDVQWLAWRELDSRTASEADILSAAGVHAGDVVAVMCEEHRAHRGRGGGVEVGAEVLYLSTALPSPQVTKVVAGKRPRVVIYDHEFADKLANVPDETRLFVARPDPAFPLPTLQEMVDVYEKRKARSA